MRAILLGGGILSVLLVGRAVADEGPLADLQGTWQVTGISLNGQEIQDKQASRSKLTFRGAELVWKSAAGSDQEKFKLEPEVDSAPLAVHVDRIEPPNRPQSGWQLFEVRDGRLRMAFFDALKGRPKSFEPQPNLVVLELEKVAKP